MFRAQTRLCTTPSSPNVVIFSVFSVVNTSLMPSSGLFDQIVFPFVLAAGSK
jgi:hypothetical protein